ncbi:MAG: hypothetical protein FJ125_18120, partial [Deltaproteobacteria bacterium]|nr:hypothetical protein [Deltaproteobacteria bacterium]
MPRSYGHLLCSALASLLACALASCGGERPVYLHQVYIDSVQPEAAGTVRMILRFLDEQGETAEPAPIDALTPVAKGYPLGRFRKMQPVQHHGIHLCLVADVALPPALFEPMRAGYLQAVEALGGDDRVILL